MPKAPSSERREWEGEEISTDPTWSYVFTENNSSRSPTSGGSRSKPPSKLTPQLAVQD